MRPIVVLVLFSLAPGARAAVDENTAGLVTEIVTAALAKEARFEVLSSADMRRQLELEANKSLLGCDAASTSCLAEIAGAMGAQLVVYGKLGTIDDVVVLTLNMFDSAHGKAAGRVVVQAASLALVTARIDGAVSELIAAYLAQMPTATKAKLLVLDVEAPHRGMATDATPAAATPPAPASRFPWLLAGGGATGVLAAGALVVAFVGDQKQVAKINDISSQAASGSTTQLGAAKDLGQVDRDGQFVIACYVAAGALAVGAAGLTVAPVVGAE